MTFRTFENGIRVAKGYASDPITGKIGELYWNTTKNVLRQCVEDTTPIWEDVTVKAGTTQYSVLIWDIVADRWVENPLILINNKTIYTADSTTPDSMTVKAGDTTNPGEFGSDLVLQPGAGDAGDGEIQVNAENVRQTLDKGTALNITAGDSTVNAAGNDLNLSAGTGTSTQGDLNTSSENVNLVAAEKIRLNGDVVFTKILATDPPSPETAQVYWHSNYSRFRVYNGTDWHWIDVNGQNIPLVAIDLFDDSILSLPPDTTTPVDGVTVTDGMLVVMQNSGSPVIYRADVAGIAITWVPQNFGQSPTVSPEVGDGIYVKNGTANTDTIFYFYSTGSWVSPFASAGAVIMPGVNPDNTVRWDGTQWIPDTTVNSNGSGLYYGEESAAVDSVKAPNLGLKGGSKTAGTGDGGDLNLEGGDSVGGVVGDVKIIGNTAVMPLGTSPVYRNGGIYISSTTGKARIGQSTIFRDIDGADINGEITGFEDLSKSFIAFTDGTRQFDLDLTGVDPIIVWLKGIRFSFSSIQSVVITNTVANHYVYIDATGTLISNTVFDLQNGLKNYVLVGIVHWNGSSGSLVADRRTLLTMDGDARYHQRNIKPIEAKLPDFAITGGNFTGSGASSYQFTLGSGNRYIEELVEAITSKSIAASDIPFLYLSSTNQVIKAAASTVPVINDSINNQYNSYSGSWSLATITAGYYVNYWLVLTTDINHPVALVVGQAIHATLNEALQESFGSLTSFLPSTEYTFLYRLTYQSIGALGVGARQYDRLFDLSSTYGRLADLTMIANTDRDLYHVEAESQDMYWAPASGQITWSAQINLALTGLAAVGSNYIAAGNVTLADGEVAYVTVNRRSGGGSLSLTVDTINNFLTQNSGHENRVIVFKRIGNECYFMRGNAEKIQKRTALLDNQVTPVAIFDFPNSTSPNYSIIVEYSIYRNGTIENGFIYVVRGAIGNIGQTIAGASNGTTGVSLNVAESGSTLQLQYTSTNTGFDAVIRYSLRSWLTT